MSTSPIGTVVPTLAPNSIIRAGIPMSDNFNATDVAVSVESLLANIPGITSGSWTPTITTLAGFDTISVILATYQTKGNICQFSIWFTAGASTPIADGDNGSIGFELPNGYTTNDVSIAAGFISNYPSRDYPTIGFTLFNGSSSITVSFTADSPTIDAVEGTIQGQFIIL